MVLKEPPNQCPLCQGYELHPIEGHHPRPYWRCGDCWLIHLDPAVYLTTEGEKAVYDGHDNSDNPSYRQFLEKLSKPIMKKMSSNAKGLDFGSGPNPVMQALFKESGFEVDIYDKYYADDATIWQKSYDFITASEVVEHLHEPRQAFGQLWQLLRPNGWFGIMTGRWLDEERFKAWRYTHDPTHVCFFHEKTCHWLADHWQANIEIISPTVFLLQKPTGE